MTGSRFTLCTTLAFAALAGLHCSAPSDPSSVASQSISGGGSAVHPSASAGLCLDVTGQSTTNGATVQVWSCSGSANQQWSYDGTSLRVYGNKCLDVTGGNAADGTKLQIWDCAAGNPNQMWTLSGSTLVWTGHGKCLDLTDGLAQNGTPAQSWTCYPGDANQKWSLGNGGSSSGGSGSGGSSGAGSSSGGSSGGGSSNGGSGGGAPAPDFGPNVLVFDPSMPASSIQGQLDSIYNQQQTNQFGRQRYAVFFKPGTYDLDVNLGFYVTAHGLGTSPDDVTIRGAVRAKADWAGGNATQNFWRGAENLSVVPQLDGNVDTWAVSQGTTLRRIHVQGNINLWDAAYQNAWSSGGFVADSKIDGTINSGTQQQFLTRNSDLGYWQGSNWNMVFVGDNAAPGNAWPNGAYTTVDATPVVREKPYLVLDGNGNYAVKVPPLRSNSVGTTWASGTSAGTLVGLDQFYVAHEGQDNAASMNAALAAGKNLLLTPGFYSLESALEVTRPDTIVLGLGLATLQPVNGNDAVDVADVDGVTVAGILFDAGAQASQTLLKVGPVGNGASHATDPILLADVFCRVGGAGAAQTSSCVVLNANNTLIDNSWLWRADHGDGVGWDTNPAANGIVVNGVDVSAYGLFVEHFEAIQTLWNAERGRVYFYQSEIPYDVPSQDRWMDGTINGFASFKVADWVTTFDARGLGAYAVFYNAVVLENAFETSGAAGVSFQHLITVWLGQNPGSAINHILNGDGATVRSGTMTARTNY